jgi:hypothetical protein
MSTPLEKDTAMLAAMRAAAIENQRLHAELAAAKRERDEMLEFKEKDIEILAKERDALKAELHTERGLHGASVHGWETARAERDRLREVLAMVPLALGHYEAADRHPHFATDLDREISKFVKAAREALAQRGEK